MTDRNSTRTHEVTDDEAVRERFRELRRTGDPRIRDELTLQFMWIPRTVARRFDQRGEAYDDLLQVGSIGIVKAVDRFDPEIGTNFVSFAMPTVVGEVRRHFRDHTWSLRVPRRAKELKPLITAAIEELQQMLNRSPTPAEIADRLRISTDDVLEAMEAAVAYRASSLDAPMATGDRPETHRALTVSDPNLGRAVDATAIGQLMESLPARSRTILYLRFFERMSQAEIAEHVGTSQVHVGRLLKSALEQLRDKIDPDDLTELV